MDVLIVCDWNSFDAIHTLENLMPSLKRRRKDGWKGAWVDNNNININKYYRGCTMLGSSSNAEFVIKEELREEKEIKYGGPQGVMHVNECVRLRECPPAYRWYVGLCGEDSTIPHQLTPKTRRGGDNFRKILHNAAKIGKPHTHTHTQRVTYRL
eukprot:GHVR01009568.1.p1 GENE.GHVR01009568.1~~GHVR01009568.1.p1  ORF type:complete len:166 (+),score=62.90 GHVR01009568.1:39-500(+)